MAVAGGPNIVEDGLVFAVDFANKKSHVSGSTSALDLVGTNDGTVTNGPVYNNGALDFDGNDDYVDFGSVDSSNPMSFYGVTNMSMESWVYPVPSGDPFQRMIDKSTGGDGADGWMFMLGASPVSTKRIAFHLNGTANPIDYTADVYTHNDWNQIVVTKEGSTWRLYTNGELVYTNSTSIAFSNVTTNMRIGSWNHTTGREWNGKIGTIRAYHKTLTAEEVLQNYNATKGRFGL